MGTSISADPDLDPSAPVDLIVTPLLDPRVLTLVDQVQAEYVVRYGGVDETPMDPAEFEPPAGRFVLGLLAGDPVACGGWRPHGAGTAEIKRMYVSAGVRRRGLARRVLAELERTAAEAGYQQMVLETGTAQPEAIALYERCGYRRVAPFGFYQDAPLAVHLGKALALTPW